MLAEILSQLVLNYRPRGRRRREIGKPRKIELKAEHASKQPTLETAKEEQELFFALLHSSLALIFAYYYTDSSSVTELITLQILHCTARSNFSLPLVKYSPQRQVLYGMRREENMLIRYRLKLSLFSTFQRRPQDKFQ
jgi:hypothetical protein